MSPTPYVIYIEERAVHVQWDPRGPFVTLHESGDVSVRYREPSGCRFVTPDRMRDIMNGGTPR